MKFRSEHNLLSRHRDDSDSPSVSNTLVIPVAGVGNTGHGAFSTAAVHFFPLRASLHHAGFAVEQPITPEHLGIVGNMEKDYRSFCRKVGRLVARHSEAIDTEAQALFIGHSFGGMFPARAYTDLDTPFQVAGAITLGSPHGEMRGYHLPGMMDKLNPYSHRCGELAEFSSATLAELNGYDGEENMVFAGSAFDEIVSLEASVPAVNGVRRAIFSNVGMRHKGYEDVPTFLTPCTSHNTMLIHPTVMHYIVEQVRELSMITGDTEAAAQPAAAQFALAQ